MILFSDIGFSLPEENSFPVLVNTIMKKGKALETSKGKYLLLEDSCGASLFAQVTIKNQIIGVLPFYKGETSWNVSIIKKVMRSETELEGALHAWASPEDPSNPESGLFPFVFDIPDYHTHHFTFPFFSKIHLTAFATATPELFTNEEEYKKRPENNALKLGTKSFIPTGLFEADELDGPSSRAMITGIISKVERKRNTTGQGDFFYVVTETQGGFIDMVFSPQLFKKAPQPGTIISGKFWLCGKVFDY